MSACRGACPDCPYDFCVPESSTQRPSKAQERRGWREDALFELEELADLYGVDPEAVRL
ncbi:hypothetical protein ACWDBP_39980 [Streptomyces sp. NPDC001233]|uniref:hypothetical protein n=1 Tax=Streptomyces sp. NPDC001127 TaxID=3154377 RepID=UPI003326754F